MIGVLAARGAPGTQMLRDPVIVLLSALTADVDARDAASTARPAAPDVFPGSARQLRRAPGTGVPAAPPPRIGAWVRAAAAGAAVVGVAGTTSIMAAGMLARLARSSASGPRRFARGWVASPHPRRTR